MLVFRLGIHCASEEQRRNSNVDCGGAMGHPADTGLPDASAESRMLPAHDAGL
jgi:hypothetical protein